MLSKISFSPSIIGSITISMEKNIIQPINSNLGTAKIVSSATNSESRVTSFPAVIGAYYLLSIQSTSNGLKDNSFTGCEIIYDYYAEMADTTPKIRSRTLLVKATAGTINISCPSGHKGYYYAKITV